MAQLVKRFLHKHGTLSSDCSIRVRNCWAVYDCNLGPARQGQEGAWVMYVTADHRLGPEQLLSSNDRLTETLWVLTGKSPFPLSAASFNRHSLSL